MGPGSPPLPPVSMGVRNHLSVSRHADAASPVPPGKGLACRLANQLMARNSRRSKVAFVLSGGAGLGAIQVGMLRALYERDIRPDLIVGTSAGALNGAFIASRPQTVETVDRLADVWRSLRRGQVFPLNPLTGLLGFLGARDHLVPASGLRRLIERHTEVKLIEQLPVPLHVVAVDVMTGEELRLSRGPLL